MLSLSEIHEDEMLHVHVIMIVAHVAYTCVTKVMNDTCHMYMNGPYLHESHMKLVVAFLDMR